jgi:phytol kinase
VIPAWIGVIAVIATATAMLLALGYYTRRWAPDAEWVRKIAHLGAGLISLSFPWLFHSRLPVLIVCGFAMSELVVLRTAQPFKLQILGVLDGLERQSCGEIYFPLSVAVLFWLSRGDRLLYGIPVLILTFADGAAALMGTQYGKHRYRATDVNKSVEGSVAFFVVAFFSVHVPLLLFTNLGRAQTLLVATLIGLLAMILEGFASRGLDNVFLPLGGFILLKANMGQSVNELAVRVLVAFGLMLLVLLYRRRTTLEGSALLGSVFVLYLAWTVGGWQWVIAPLTAFLFYSFLAPRHPHPQDRKHNVFAVLSVASPGLVWLFLAEALQHPALFFPYAVAFAANLAIIGYTLTCEMFPSWPVRAALPVCILKAWLLIFIPFVAIQHFNRHALWQAPAALLIIIAVAMLFYRLQRRGRDTAYPLDPSRWLRQACIVGLGTLMALVSA